MPKLNQVFLFFVLMFSMGLALAVNCGNCAKQKNCPKVCDRCCGGMGGVRYCDSSAGRLVCNNGSYSSCYCDRHAVMELERIEECCLWQGGVLDTNINGVVICNNGGVSEVCTIQNPPQSIANF